MKKVFSLFLFAIFLIILLQLINLLRPEHKLIGYSETTRYSFTEKALAILKGTRVFTTQSKLELNADSTFRQIAHNYFSKGNWAVKQDTLILCRTTEYIQKGNSFILNSKKGMKKYLIEANRLIRYSQGNWCANRKPDGTIEMKNNFDLEILR